jgi:ribonucleoside-triphosphate reductase
MMETAKRSLEIKRKVISKFMEEGLYPYAKRYLGNFDTHFSTIGLVGLNEAALNASWVKKNLTSKEGIAFGERVLDFMREKIADFQEETGNLYNLEASPAESTTYRLAKMDKERYPGIADAGKPGEAPFYTNSCHLPVDYTRDIFDALDIQEGLQGKFTGGTVFHTFLGEKVSDWRTCANLVKKIAENYKIPYYTISPTYSICKEHGYISGEVEFCPECGKETEVYSRITGYYRPVKHWNDGKQSEYINRKEYSIEISMDYHNESLEEVAEKILFTTKSCPRCPEAKEKLEGHNVIFVDAMENMEDAEKYGIRSVPTLVLINNDSKAKKYVGVDGINQYLQGN